MADNLGPGLTDFGLVAPSESASVGDDREPLEALLGGLDNALLDDVAREKMLRGRLEELAAAEDPSLLDKLKSPRGIASLLGTVAAGAAGGPGAALGFGLGAVNALGDSAEAEASARRAAMDQTQERIEDVQERLLKRNQMFATALQTAPDQFIDPETGELSAPPELLGYFAYGMPIKTNPATKRILDQRDERWTSRMSILEDALAGTTDIGHARTITKAMFQHMGIENPASEELEAVAASVGSEEFDRQFAGTLLRYGGKTALDAMIFAGEEGLELHHPEVLRHIKFTDPEGSTAPSQVLNQRFIELMDQVRTWEQDPSNAQLVGSIRKEAATPEEARRQIAEQALVDAADVAFYEQKMGGAPSHIRAQLQASYNATVAELGLVSTVRGAQNITEFAGLPEGEFRRRSAEMAWQSLEQNQQAVIEGQAMSAAALLDTQTGVLIDAFPGASHSAARRQAQALYDQSVKELGPNATQQDVEARFSAKVRLYINTTR